MSRPTLFICRSCEKKRGGDAWSGELLFQTVKTLRRDRGLKDLFGLEGVDCLDRCDTPCNVQLEGKKRSTLARSDVNALVEGAPLVEAAAAYARLEPGKELLERVLPGSAAK